MTDRELMQMALDALDKYGFMPLEDEIGWQHFKKTIEALRARLAQPEQDDGYCQACDGDSCTAKEGCVARDNPPPQREWQGLTDEELLDIADMAYANDLELLQTLQAKLKEKNHG